MDLTLTEDRITNLLSIVDKGLTAGMGMRIPGEMCVEAAVCFAFGLPHGDYPPCVGLSVRHFKIQLNDSCWSSDLARAAGMRRLAVAQLGSDALPQRIFTDMIMTRTTQQILSEILDRAGLKREAKACMDCTDFNSAWAAVENAKTASTVAYGLDSSNSSHLSAAALDVSENLVYAARHGHAKSVASAARIDSGYIPDRYLLMSAEIALSALKELKSPGCEFLYLCD